MKTVAKKPGRIEIVADAIHGRNPKPKRRSRPSASGPVSDRMVFHPPLPTQGDYTNRVTGSPEPGPAKSAHPDLDRDRKLNRERIARDLQEREQELLAKPRLRGSLSLEQRNELLDYYQDTIGRVVTMALKRGVPDYVTREDLHGRLTLALVRILDRYRPMPGVHKDAYVWRCLQGEKDEAIGGEIAKAINAEVEDRQGLFQLNRTISDIPMNGRRARAQLPHDPDDRESSNPPSSDKERRAAGFQRASDWQPNQKPTTPMLSWNDLRKREGPPEPRTSFALPSGDRRILKLDVRAAVRTLDRDKRNAIRLWMERGYTQDEIGVHLHLPQPAVCRLLAGAIKKMRLALAEYDRLEFSATVPTAKRKRAPVPERPPYLDVPDGVVRASPQKAAQAPEGLYPKYLPAPWYAQNKRNPIPC